MKKRFNITGSFIISIGLLLVIFIIDIIIPLGPSVGVLYLIPIVLLAREQKTDIIIISVLASLLLLSKFFLYFNQATLLPGWTILFNRGASLFTIWIVVALITRYKKRIEYHDEKQRQSDENIRSIFNNSRSGFILIDSSKIVLAVNKIAINTSMGVNGNPMIEGEPVMKYIAPERRESFEALLDKAFNGIGTEYEVNYFRGGVKKYYYCHMLPVETAPGKITGVTVYSHDITPIKEANALLEQNMADLARSNKELEQFAYVASHDLQEPLRMVASYVQLLERRYKDKLDKDANEFIEFAVDGANRMKQLINDLLMYSRAGRGFEEINKVDLNEVVDKALKNLATSIEESSASITREKLPVIIAAPTEMLQLFQNLISNAIKFRREGIKPEVHIAVKDRGTQWLFSVKDNGIGIENEYADKLFIIFRRLNDKSKYAGTGIGLAIAKKITERYQGRIWFESGLANGTTFYFTIYKKAYSSQLGEKELLHEKQDS